MALPSPVPSACPAVQLASMHPPASALLASRPVRPALARLQHVRPARRLSFCTARRASASALLDRSQVATSARPARRPVPRAPCRRTTARRASPRPTCPPVIA